MEDDTVTVSFANVGESFQDEEIETTLKVVASQVVSTPRQLGDKASPRSIGMSTLFLAGQQLDEGGNRHCFVARWEKYEGRDRD